MDIYHRCTVAKILLLTLYTYCRSQNGFLYDYGLSVGDTLSPVADDACDVSYHDMDIALFGQTYDTVYVCTNGIISLNDELTTYTPSSFPLSTGVAVIAAFWADADPRKGGSVWSRVTTDTELLANASSIVSSSYGTRFRGTRGLVVTWEEVKAYGSYSYSPDNTFQAVIITNEVDTYVMYMYESITWTYGSASNGIPAQVGFDAGNGIDYYAVPTSQTSAIEDIDIDSNIGVIGQWMFKLANGAVETPDPSATAPPSTLPITTTVPTSTTTSPATTKLTTTTPTTITITTTTTGTSTTTTTPTTTSAAPTTSETSIISNNTPAATVTGSSETSTTTQTISLITSESARPIVPTPSTTTRSTTTVATSSSTIPSSTTATTTSTSVSSTSTVTPAVARTASSPAAQISTLVTANPASLTSTGTSNTGNPMHITISTTARATSVTNAALTTTSKNISNSPRTTSVVPTPAGVTLSEATLPTAASVISSPLTTVNTRTPNRLSTTSTAASLNPTTAPISMTTAFGRSVATLVMSSVATTLANNTPTAPDPDSDSLSTTTVLNVVETTTLKPQIIDIASSPTSVDSISRTVVPSSITARTSQSATDRSVSNVIELSSEGFTADQTSTEVPIQPPGAAQAQKVAAASSSSLLSLLALVALVLGLLYYLKKRKKKNLDVDDIESYSEEIISEAPRHHTWPQILEQEVSDMQMSKCLDVNSALDANGVTLQEKSMERIATPLTPVDTPDPGFC